MIREHVEFLNRTQLQQSLIQESCRPRAFFGIYDIDSSQDHNMYFYGIRLKIYILYALRSLFLPHTHILTDAMQSLL